MTRMASFIVVAGLAAGIAGCDTAPPTPSGKAELTDDVSATLNRMQLEDPSLQEFLDNSYGYAIFPTVGKGAFIAGGGYGKGELFEQGQFVGYTDISQATVGAQVGGATFSEILVFNTPAPVERFKQGQLAFDANASAVALKSGAAASAQYEDGVAIFVEARAGFILEAAVGGQSFAFQPK